MIFTGAGTSRRSVQPSDKLTPSIDAPTGAFQGSTAGGLSSLLFEQPVRPVTSNMTSAPRTASGTVFMYRLIVQTMNLSCQFIHRLRELPVPSEMSPTRVKE